MVFVQAPGKLILSGEWSVLEQGNPAIAMAVDSASTVLIKEKPQTVISSPNFGIKKIFCEFDGRSLEMQNATPKQKEVLRFVKSAAETALRYLSEKGIPLKKFEMATDSKKNSIKKLDGSFQKVGFGSSAAITVATVAAVLELHGEQIKKNRETIYKLATISHFLGQDRAGSAVDIAASTFGGLVFYKSFDGLWLLSALEKKPLLAVVESNWHGFFAQEIPIPKNFEVIVAFSGKSSSTTKLVEKMNHFKEMSPADYMQVIGSIKDTTQKLASALKKGEKEKTLQLIAQNRGLLKMLSEKSENNLETVELSKIIETMDKFGAAAKFSGAGGGDCAIGVCYSKETKQRIINALKEKGLKPLDINISPTGVFRAD